MKYLVFILLLLSVQTLQSSYSDSLRTDLSELLKERQKLFNEYSESVNKKSGIFGSKTKNDLRDSQEKLKGIVEADNKIINSLNRTIDFRSYEKLNLTYDASSYIKRIENLTTLNETLQKQNAKHTDEIAAYKSEIKKFKLYRVITIAAFIALILLYAIRKYMRS